MTSALPFRRVLIANRGEIACRIQHTCHRLGLETVAVFSDADADAQHVRLADHAVRIGPAPPRESYLSIPAVIAAAREACADAVHPGYGFLSENPEFAEACTTAGLTFVGPPAAAIRAMGLKDAAKAVARAAGVPVLPGAAPDDADPAAVDGALTLAAQAIGFPVLLKAVAGGGGRGMRRVEAIEALPAAIRSARREAGSSFGDDRLMVERLVARARHVEVQVLADRHGHVVHLFERDCSLQRRHQKVVEEAPAPGVPAAMREAMGAAAIQLARAVGYEGLGTVEFVLDVADGPRIDRFWFMEMNTRLQVEHPVTEAITGLDLVEQQLRVAAGFPLDFHQADLALRGHAVEVRLCAEDPARNYLPSPGRLQVFDLPQALRVETGLRPRDDVTPWYDNLLAKIVSHGETRAAALDALAAGLEVTRVEGLATNLDLLRAVVASAAFRSGEVNTGFLDVHRAELIAANAPLAAAVR